MDLRHRCLAFEVVSTYSAVLMRSVGATAMMLSTQPAAIPARIPRARDSLPFSTKVHFAESNDNNHTLAFLSLP